MCLHLYDFGVTCMSVLYLHALSKSRKNGVMVVCGLLLFDGHNVGDHDLFLNPADTIYIYVR